MRNLQKILALALALIMSFSLVITANAFDDDDQITENYADAVTVLAGLEVFKGYTDGTYKPQDSISRAEVAAIIYRITTGDVADAQRDVYSDWNRFTDVKTGEWWAGYINYCANAEYIKGYGNGKFGPDDDVTGYEALAMILRALGYGKMGEFVGSDWAVNTAARANSLKITKNVTAATLGAPATRELVAELLFRSILQKTVQYNTVTGYVEDETTLGKQTLNLDEVTGVVMANEYASLTDDSVLAEGKTQLEVASNDTRTLDYTTDLNDVGMSKFAYIQGSKVLALTDAGTNVVYDNTADKGEGVDIADDDDFEDVSGLKKQDSTEFYTNFEPTAIYKSDYRIEFEVIFDSVAAEEKFDDYKTDISKVAMDSKYHDRYDVTAEWVDSSSGTAVAKSDIYGVSGTGAGHDDGAASDGDFETWLAGHYKAAGHTITYHMVFKAGDKISEDDLDVIDGIFGFADNDERVDGVEGSVWAGSTGKKNEDDDLSNSISYKKFKDEYINPEETNSWDESVDGEWVKIIDNNADGKAEYAFLTTFTLDKAVDTYTKSGEDYLEYYAVDIIDDYDARYMNEVAVGDIVLHTEIDGQSLIWKAEIDEDTITRIAYKDETVTTTGGETYPQSEITNATRLEQIITEMSDSVNYRMYLDAFGRIRAYEPVDGIKYALVTELYYDNTQNDRFAINSDLTVEMFAGSSVAKEYKVSNDNASDFLLYCGYKPNGRTVVNTWGELDDIVGKAGSDVTDVYDASHASGSTTRWDNNVLQPATKSLGLRNDNKAFVNYVEPAKRTEKDIFSWATTNVARYITLADGEVRLLTAAQDDQLTTSNRYYIDYVNLNETKIDEDQSLYRLDTTNDKDHGNFVNATRDTQFYIVTEEGVSYFTGYSNMPKIDKNITAAYAVARDVVEDRQDNHYWVADVIVIECPEYENDFDDVVLLIGKANDYEKLDSNTTMAQETKADTARNFVGIQAKDSSRVVTVDVDKFTWGTQWDGPGFYAAYGITKDGDDAISVDELRPIDINDKNDLVKYRINAGRIDKGVRIANDYFQVTRKDNGDTGFAFGAPMTREEGIGLTLKGSAYAVINKKSGNVDQVDTVKLYARDTKYNDDKVEYSDDIIWVANSDGDALLVVDLTWDNKSGWETPSWLKSDFGDITTNQLSEYMGDATEVTYADAMAKANAALKTDTKDALSAALVELRKVDTSKLTDAEKDALAAKIVEVKTALEALGGSSDPTKLSPEDTARALIAAQKAFQEAYAAAKAKSGSTADTIAADADVIKTTAAFQKAGTAYVKLSAADLAKITSAVKTAADTVASASPDGNFASDPENYAPTLGNVLTHAAAIAIAGASTGSTMNTAAKIVNVKKDRDALTDAENELYIAIKDAADSTGAQTKTYEGQKAAVDKVIANTKKLIDALVLVKKGFDDSTDYTLTAAAAAASKKAALDAWTALSSKEKTKAEELGDTDYAGAVAWIKLEAGNTATDAAVSKVTLKKGLEKVLDWKVVTENVEYTLTVPSTVTVDNTWLKANITVTASAGTNATNWTAEIPEDDYDVWTWTVAGTGSPTAGKNAVVTVKVAQTEEAAPYDDIDQYVGTPTVTVDEADPNSIGVKLTIGTKGETVVTSNLEDFDNNVIEMTGNMKETSVGKLVAVSLDLLGGEYGIEQYDSTTPVQIVQTNAALKNYKSNGNGVDVTAGTKTKQYTYGDLVDGYAILLQEGSPVTLVVTIDVDSDGIGGGNGSDDVVVTIRITNNVTIVG